jgi:tetratricopeptide (TPR) repeat protein
MNTLGRSFFCVSISLLGLAFEWHPPETADQLALLRLQVDGSLPQTRQLAPERDLQLGETIAVADLRLPVPAAKELRLSLKRFHSGDLRDSARHLEEAILIDDTIPVAHYNLGICYLHLGQYEKAMSEFQKASAQDSRSIQSRIGLTEALFILKRYEEAETAARGAYQLDAVNPDVRYLLGRIWAAEGRDGPEVFEMLRASRTQFPPAHLVLASLLLKHRATDAAISELREYLNRPGAPDEDKVACMIQVLSQPGSASTCAVN